MFHEQTETSEKSLKANVTKITHNMHDLIDFWANNKHFRKINKCLHCSWNKYNNFSKEPMLKNIFKARNLILKQYLAVQ